jgi:hypothetical protein
MNSSLLISPHHGLRLFALVCLVMFGAATAAADSPGSFSGKTIEFPAPYVYPMNKGAGYATVQKCAICHSFGYILNQGKQARTFWAHETHKMVETYKAPITPEEEQVIVNYLAEFYGNGRN